MQAGRPYKDRRFPSGQFNGAIARFLSVIQWCDRLFHFRQLYWAQRFEPRAIRPSVGAGFTDNLSAQTGN